LGADWLYWLLEDVDIGLAISIEGANNDATVLAAERPSRSQTLGQPDKIYKRKYGALYNHDSNFKRIRTGPYGTYASAGVSVGVPTSTTTSSSFQLLDTLYSANPNRKPLRVFRYREEIFVLKPDLLAVLNLKNTRFLHLQESETISADLFKTWAKESEIGVGGNIKLFILANKSLVELLVKYDETVTISLSLTQLIKQS
jgi:hypothetical protein